jgi:TolB-like protein/DNA-binding winged helix-turn-helix (wHTH) protein/Tfp pilus assembly protein PilF
MAPSPEDGVLHFGVFELDLHSGELCKSGHKTALRPQAAKVLALLTSRPAQLVTREELKDEIWGPDTFVDFEHGLNLCIRQIRAALDDDADTPRYVETLPRRGYRFIAPVQSTNGHVEPSSAPRSRVSAKTLAIGGVMVVVAILVAATYFLFGHKTPGAAMPQITSLAVLPLVNLSGDADQEYFADGMTEELIANLSKIKALKVISRTSVMRYKGTKKPLPEIARELAVDGIIEGSVLRAGNRVRITAQLISAASDTHLWAGNFDRDLRDVLTLQNEVARAITQEVRVAVTPAEPDLASARQVNPEAHELYLKGRYYWWKRQAPEMAKAIQAFEQAIAIDPNYAAAYAGLADAYSISIDNGFLPPGVGKVKAKSAALKAVALDDSLAEAHVALGLVYDNYDWGWARAEAEYRRAIALNPNSAVAQFMYAALLNELGRHEEAIAANRRALELDPLATRINAHLALALYYARRYDEAIAASQKTLELEPGDPMGHMVLGQAYLEKGMHAQALVELEALSRVAGENAACCGPLARAYAAAGKTGKARRLIDRWIAESKRGYKSPYVIAEGYVGLGNDDQAFAWLEKAYQQRDPQFTSGIVDPIWDRFRSDPRFSDLLRRVDIPH